jgi:predicted acyl esterase
MWLHFGRGEQNPQSRPNLRQVSNRQLETIRNPCNSFKINTVTFSNRPKKTCLRRVSGPVLSPSHRARFALYLLLAAVLLPSAAFPQTSLPTPTKPRTSPPIYPSMAKVQTWIPMKDGVKLAVNLYVPEGAKPDEKFPAILEYLPYRKDDWSL